MKIIDGRDASRNPVLPTKFEIMVIRFQAQTAGVVWYFAKAAVVRIGTGQASEGSLYDHCTIKVTRTGTSQGLAARANINSPNKSVATCPASTLLVGCSISFGSDPAAEC